MSTAHRMNGGTAPVCTRHLRCCARPYSRQQMHDRIGMHDAVCLPHELMAGVAPAPLWAYAPWSAWWPWPRRWPLGHIAGIVCTTPLGASIIGAALGAAAATPRHYRCWAILEEKSVPACNIRATGFAARQQETAGQTVYVALLPLLPMFSDFFDLLLRPPCLQSAYAISHIYIYFFLQSRVTRATNRLLPAVLCCPMLPLGFTPSF